ncbi:1-phosphatidylinositol-3-phosphate 5-kinase FAB1B-like isoform X2 [Actinidia eriantha]|uniref:1-phosphatidylinositol-3-phosphate 5-kinase FAB1B-like isoform X2 n=1 Tax=Actinidia eriantha TaxID=165200 RepID=UPI002584A955|nr:1-phosphatidylinositol-3-phosphate 5-kinase FAB1B-like isoform X2 [Actinidia eriantha]
MYVLVIVWIAAGRAGWLKDLPSRCQFRLHPVDNGIQVANLNLSTSPSTTNLLSTKSSGIIDSSCLTFASMPHSVEYYQQNNPSDLSPRESEAMETNVDGEGVVASKRSNDHTDMPNPSPNQFEFCMNRSDDDDDEFGVLRLDSKTRHVHQTNGYYAQVEFDEIHNGYSSHKVHPDGETIDTKSVSCSSLHNSFDSVGSEGIQQLVKKEGEHDIGDECEAPSSLYPTADVDTEPLDFESNGLLWLPPEPEDEEDEREALLFDDDDEGVATGEWGYLRSSSSFGSGEHRNRDRSNEEHKKAMKNVVDGHFRALVAQLLQVENLPLAEEDDKESWLEIITSLSWEAATLLKPDMSKGGGMDPGGYVKVKCLASGRRSESMAIKGVVCKKNVAHRRMTSRIEKPRLLILGGALEYQRVSNLLSSFDTLLQQEMDHLKMAVAKIDAHQPDVLLVEKSVSRFAQEYLLAKDISLVLNIKRPLLERIARCTGSQIVPSIDHLSSQKLGYCDMFHVERFLEEHGTAGQGGKKLVKTLMYFEGCPKPLGCTILLRGANGDELKKVKHVIQYGVFAAYHLALETSFLADEGASLPELPLNSPLTVALPDKPSSFDRSISTIPGFTVLANERTEGPQPCVEPQRFNNIPASDLVSLIPSGSFCKVDTALLPSLPSQYTKPASSFVNSTGPVAPSGQGVTGFCHSESFSYLVSQEKSMMLSKELSEAKTSAAYGGRYAIGDKLFAAGRGLHANNAQNDSHTANVNQLGSSDVSSLQQEVNLCEEQGSSKDEFPPSPSDHQSILVSLSSRCVWKGTVCERSHLFRIKYYGNFDKPLGRFLRDHLFDQSYRCRSCDMPSEAHVHCYTHRQGALTISVKKLPEFLLPGEREGKIWMWHRCLRCPRTNGFPPTSQRIVMLDAAWGLSFGKFLELSFSNHAAASRVASCGHSLHRDCFRFYGFGKMVACFRYVSIDVHSVYLPPPKLDFKYENQDWIQKDLSEMDSSGPHNNGTKLCESRRQIVELEAMLQKEKSEFEDSLQKIVRKEVKKGQPGIDILEINRLRRQLLFQSYMWDSHLIDRSLNKNFLASSQKLYAFGEYNPVYVSSFWELELQSGARLLLPVGANDIVVPVYDDEPTSIISYALFCQLSDEYEKPKDTGEPTVLLQSVDSGAFQSFASFDEMTLESYRSLGSTDDSISYMSGSRSSLALDPVSYTKALHVRVSFSDDGPLGKVKYTVTCYYAKRFEALRRICCPSEMDFVRSLSRCKKWGAQGGKSNVFFAKTLDDRFIIKQVTKTELESFIKFAPGYFKYLSESIGTGSPTCLAKILGIYQVTSKHLKGGKESKMDVLVMENLLFRRNLTRLYDLKGSSRSRYNPDSSGSNKVLLDQNLIEAMPTSPIFVGSKAKRLLERAVWNDTSFLASIDVMDYSLLVGIDEEKHELVLGIIDFMRQYTWDKNLETWVKSSCILGGPKNASPTVIPPNRYKKRFRKAMTTYFLMVPDQWSSPAIIPRKSQTDLYEESNTQGGTSVD